MAFITWINGLMRIALKADASSIILNSTYCRGWEFPVNIVIVRTDYTKKQSK